MKMPKFFLNHKDDKSMNNDTHVFKVGEFAAITKKGDLFNRGKVGRIDDAKYNLDGNHVYWLKLSPSSDMVTGPYMQGDISFTNVVPECWNNANSNPDKIFTKKDVKPGMLVVTRDDNKYLIMDNDHGERFMISLNDWGCFENWEADLSLLVDRENEFDIMKVYSRPKVICRPSNVFDTSDRDLLWERESKSREMTVAEISKALGYEVKIVK